MEYGKEDIVTCSPNDQDKSDDDMTLHVDLVWHNFKAGAEVARQTASVFLGRMTSRKCSTFPNPIWFDHTYLYKMKGLQDK